MVQSKFSVNSHKMEIDLKTVCWIGLERLEWGSQFGAIVTAPKKGSESPTRMANSGHGEEELCVRDLQSLTCRIW